MFSSRLGAVVVLWTLVMLVAPPLAGLNTFILTESGGSQGLGFAIPSAIIAATYTVKSLDVLHVLVDDAKANTEMVLQIERSGQLLFVTCRIY